LLNVVATHKTILCQIGFHAIANLIFSAAC
jgi:hypothetical protein